MLSGDSISLEISKFGKRNSEQSESQSDARVSLSVSRTMESRAPMVTGSAEDDPLAKDADVRRSERLPSSTGLACVYYTTETITGWLEVADRLLAHFFRDRRTRSKDWWFNLLDSWGKFDPLLAQLLQPHQPRIKQGANTRSFALTIAWLQLALHYLSRWSNTKLL